MVEQTKDLMVQPRVILEQAWHIVILEQDGDGVGEKQDRLKVEKAEEEDRTYQVTQWISQNMKQELP